MIKNHVNPMKQLVNVQTYLRIAQKLRFKCSVYVSPQYEIHFQVG
jgi:hypothetical protein